ncbi:putative RNA-dependent RNA polymerase [Sclerotium rolfsii fusarivirus 2]|uniref:RNA-dependent RNA polymerase n=1 Tax=Sclerotium rolfsii fusarivirus 2 TaxID=2490824 RepID=A0AAD1EEP9_9VIRU|nr:putative RNA-dependent RNA polymerase [Sclerotium rolfsii fusarivirus 2]AZF86098.1 putative RNA-dependent RNA polymerase [Sclerotium rolfsii fusarivirus 2]
MLQFALLLISIWGTSLPVTIPPENLVAKFPGEIPDTAGPDFPMFVAGIVNWGMQQHVAERFSLIGFLIYATFVVMVTLSLLSAFLPFATIVLMFWLMGPIFVTTWAATLSIAACILVSAAVSSLQPIWIFVVNWITTEYLKLHPENTDRFKSYVESVARNVKAAADENRVEFILYGGRIYDPKAIMMLNEEDVNLTFAICTAWIWCPLPRAGLLPFAICCAFWVFWFNKKIYAMVRAFLTGWMIWTKIAISFLVLIFAVSPSTLALLSDLILFVISLPFWLLSIFRHGGLHSSYQAARLLVLVAVLRLLNVAFKTSILFDKQGAGPVKGISPATMKFRAIWNNAIMDVNRAIDQIALPHFIRTLPERFDAEAINETQQILASLGWPASDPVVLDEPVKPDNIGTYRHAYLGTVRSIKQGVHRLQLQVAEELDNLKGLAPEYKRSDEYVTIENELESLARYFDDPAITLPDLPISEVFELVGDIFRNSRLTKFTVIVKNLEKAYGLGPFWRDYRVKRWKKLSRRQFIKDIGGIGNFIRLWARTFERAPGLVPVAPVSVKSEALPPKKWMADKVRTIIGAPIAHYIMSTVWNYWPNHNFRYWSTNIKVGMPLNGKVLGMLVTEHSAFDEHFAGDFTNFDSTVVGKMSQLIAEVRKKGFEYHRDYARICYLIDANYKILQKMPMMTTSTGNVYDKRTGLSTGHSSTSMDNSLAVTIYYIIAWRELTGLSAHEFRHYCKLSNYGDDHILSWRASAPATWTRENIIKCLAKYGVGLRDEEPSHKLERFEFLSKKWRRPTTADIVELTEAGVAVPAWIVYHNPIKLIGKAYAPSKDVKVDRRYRVKRLVSYLYLTAGHRDLYDKLRVDIEKILNKKGSVMRSPVPIPSYTEVVARWHDENSVVGEPEADRPEDINDKAIVLDYTMSLGLDSLLHVASVIPDFVNPAVYNIGYTNYLIGLFGERVAWPIELIRRSNSAVTATLIVSLLKRSPYDFLADHNRLSTMSIVAGNGTLLLRHWLFIALGGPQLTPNTFQLLAWLDKKIAALNFLINGHIQTFVRRLDLPILQIILIAALSYVPDVPVPRWILLIRIPSVSFLVESFYGYLLNTFWSKVPANMKQASAALQLQGPEMPAVLIEAPTGTGKSTTFVNFVWRNHRFNYKRVILVVPRQLLVLTLTPYLRDAFALPAHEITEGHSYDETYSLIVTTPQEVLLHELWLTEGNLFLIDEAHVLEPPLMACMTAIQRMHACYIMLTATPSQSNMDVANIHVPLQIAQTWTIVDQEITGIFADTPISMALYWEDYRARVLSLARAHMLSKFLIFVVGIGHAQDLAHRLGRRCCVLSSQSKVIDPEAEVFIATSVADVGLTIPDVDWVISSNVTKTMVAEGTYGKVSLAKADAALLRQRRGRTGRTKSGISTVIKYGDIIGQSPVGTWSENQIGVTMLKSGVPPAVVARFMPGAITSLWDTEYTRNEDSLIDSFVANSTVMFKELEREHQRTFASALDDDFDMGDLWTVQGNTIPVRQNLVPNRNDWDANIAPPATAHQMFDFVVGASLYLVKNHMTMNPEKFRNFLRTNMLSSNRFMGAFYAQSAMDEPIGDVSHLGDETGSFGRYVVARSRRRPEADNAIMDGFHTFGKPIDRNELVGIPVPEPSASTNSDLPPLTGDYSYKPVNWWEKPGAAPPS